MTLEQIYKNLTILLNHGNKVFSLDESDAAIQTLKALDKIIQESKQPLQSLPNE